MGIAGRDRGLHRAASKLGNDCRWSCHTSCIVSRLVSSCGCALRFASSIGIGGHERQSHGSSRQHRQKLHQSMGLQCVCRIGLTSRSGDIGCVVPLPLFSHMCQVVSSLVCHCAKVQLLHLGSFQADVMRCCAAFIYFSSCDAARVIINTSYGTYVVCGQEKQSKAN